MDNRNRPVTGYPAANPPPSGTAYPYAAAPAPGGYYSYYQNYTQHYQRQDADSIRRAACLRRIFAFIIGSTIIWATATFIVWLVLRPQLPEFRVDSFSVSNFSLGNNSLISFTSHIGLTARNPNKKMSLDYDQMEAVLFYESQSLAKTAVPPFLQDRRNETSMTASFAASGSFVDKYVVEGITGDREKNGNVNFNVRMVSWVKFEAKAWRARARFLKVFCGDLIVGIPSNKSSAELIGGPKQCRVGI